MDPQFANWIPVSYTQLLVGLASLNGVSIANLRPVDMTSSRNQLILGLALLLGMALPHFMSIRGSQPITGQSVLAQPGVQDSNKGCRDNKYASSA